jgi:hypothetical protein
VGVRTGGGRWWLRQLRIEHHEQLLGTLLRRRVSQPGVQVLTRQGDAYGFFSLAFRLTAASLALAFAIAVINFARPGREEIESCPCR